MHNSFLQVNFIVKKNEHFGTSHGLLIYNDAFAIKTSTFLSDDKKVCHKPPMLLFIMPSHYWHRLYIAHRCDCEREWLSVSVSPVINTKSAGISSSPCGPLKDKAGRVNGWMDA